MAHIYDLDESGSALAQHCASTAMIYVMHVSATQAIAATMRPALAMRPRMGYVCALK